MIDRAGEARSFSSVILSRRYVCDRTKIVVGWDEKKQRWTDKERDKDMGQLALRTSKEFVNQIPLGGLGLMASTTLGSALSEYTLKNTALQLLPGEQGHYDRAGIVIPKRWGGSGDGPGSESGFERLAYSGGRMFLNDISSRSTLTGGVTSLVDPIAQISNAKEDVSAWDASLIWMSQFPAMPREFRREFQRKFQDDTKAKIWDGSYRQR